MMPPRKIIITSKPSKGRGPALQRSLSPADIRMIVDALSQLPTTTPDFERRLEIMRFLESAAA